MAVSANHPYEAYIWEYVFGKLGNAIGTAAMMGNFWAESSLYPNRLQSSKVGDGTSEAYTSKVDNGTITRSQFINNGPGGGGYGLAQWTYHTRKANMYDLWKSGGYPSIGDINLALDFWWWELNNGYSGTRNALKNATNIRTASDYVLTKYERPADQGTNAQKKRADRAQLYYDYYADGDYEPPQEPTPDTPSTQPTEAGYYYCTAPEGQYVNIRSGPGTSNSVVDILHRGDAVYVVSFADGWAKINSPVDGYVMAPWLQSEPIGGGYFPPVRYDNFMMKYLTLYKGRRYRVVR